MTYYYSKLLVTLLTVAAWAGSALADDVLCGATVDENASESVPDLLDDEFRALLSGSKTHDAPVVKNKQPASIKRHFSVATESRTAESPLRTVTPVAKKLLPRTCVLRDPENARDLLTLTIPGNVSAEQISPEELAALREAQEAVERLPQMEQHQASNDYRPRLMIRRNAQTAAIHVDARNSDVRDVLRGISSRTGKRILFHPDLEGTISTTSEAEGVVVLVRTMLEPFNFSIVASANHLIVCGPNETPGSVLAAISKRQDASKRKVAFKRKTVRIETPRASVAERPSTHATAPRLNPVLHPAKEPSIQLVAAQTTQINPPRLRQPRLTAEPQTVESLAAERIARVAQDAFASGQTEYSREVLQQGLQRFPSSAMLRRILGESLYLEGNFAEAAEALSNAIKLDKEEPLANELMGKTLKALGQKERAYHYFLQAQQIRRATR